MSKIKLTLTSLKQLEDGKVVLAFDRELARVVRDCVDRPGDATARKVTLTMIVTPDAYEGVCEAVNSEFRVQSSVPVRRSRPYHMEVDARGAVLVNPASPEQVNQHTLDEVNHEQEDD